MVLEPRDASLPTPHVILPNVSSLFLENVYDAIRKRLYVDDGHGGGSEVDEALQLKNNLIEAMAKGGFSLLHQEPGGPIPVVEDRMEKILGVHWNPCQDNFRFTLDIKQFNLPARTPHQLVSVTSSLYDPSGFIAPFILLGRQFLQRAQKGRRGWDTPLDADLLEEFFVWTSSIPLLRNYPIFVVSESCFWFWSLQLHYFLHHTPSCRTYKAESLSGQLLRRNQEETLRG